MEIRRILLRFVIELSIFIYSKRIYYSFIDSWSNIIQSMNIYMYTYSVLSNGEDSCERKNYSNYRCSEEEKGASSIGVIRKRVGSEIIMCIAARRTARMGVVVDLFEGSMNINLYQMHVCKYLLYLQNLIKSVNRI